MNKRTKKSNILILVGCCCVLGAAALYVYNARISGESAKKSGELLSLMKNSISAAAGESEQRDPALDSADAPANTESADAFKVRGYDIIGTLEADAIEIKLPVISKWSYPNLRVAPCRYSGTPDTKMVLLAHNYEGHFGKLKELEKGDIVTFTDVKNRVYRYQVIRTEMIGGNDMNAILSGNDWNLTLFTCTYSGSSRVIIRCCRN